MIEAHKVAERAIVANRYKQEHSVRNFSIMFPDILNTANERCWRSAISNYIEDQWNQSFRENVYKQEPNGLVDRVDKYEDFYEAVRRQLNPYHLFAKDLEVTKSFLDSIWIIASGVYKNERVLFQVPDKAGQTPPVNEQMIVNYKQYFTNCAVLNPISWANSGEKLLITPVQVCVGRCL